MLRRPATRIQLADDEVSDLIRDLQKRKFDERVRASNLQQLNLNSRSKSTRSSKNSGTADIDYSRTPSSRSANVHEHEHELEPELEHPFDSVHPQYYQTLPHNLEYLGATPNRYELVKRYYVDSNVVHFQESPINNSSANNNHNFVMRNSRELPLPPPPPPLPGDISPSRPARRNQVPSESEVNTDLEARPARLDPNPFFQMEQQ